MRGIRLLFRGEWLAFGAFLGLFAIAEPAVAQDFNLVTTLVHPNPRVNNEDRFGSGVAISGGTLFVGAKDEQAANAYSGVVHVFSDADWSEVAQLKSSVDTDIEFGAAIQLDGERALISNAAIDEGVVWFFEKVAGVWTEKLRVQGLVDEAFGYRLALHGDFAFIGVPRLGTGNVRVYRHAAGTWSEVQVLTASDAQAGDVFGYSIAFDGQRLAVAAPGGLQGQTRQGLYTFSLVGDAFVEDGKLAGDDPAVQRFAADVGVSGDTLVVNAPAANQLSNGGKALVYERHGEQWELDSELNMGSEESVPEGLAMDHDTLWFGASTSDPRSRSVYAFERVNGGWQEAQKLSFPNLGEYELTSWTFQDGTFAIGFWNGLRTESVQIYRRAGHESSSDGGSPSGSAGAEAAGGSGATGNTTGGGAPGEGAGTAGAAAAGATAAGAAAGVSSNSDTSGGAGVASNEGAAAGPAANSGSSERGGCTLAPRSNARAWPLAVLAFALALTRKRRTGPAAITRTNS